MPPLKGRLRTLPLTITTPDLDPEEEKLLIDVFLQIARSCGLPKVDYKAMAEGLGFKTPASATTAWYDLKKKLKNAIAEEVTSTVAASSAGAAVVPTVKGSGKAKSKTAALAAATGTGLRRSGRKPFESEAPKTAVAVATAAAAASPTSEGFRRSRRKLNVSEAPKTDEKEQPKRRSRPLTTEEKVALIKSEIDPMLLLCRGRYNSNDCGSEGDMDLSDGSGNE